MSSEGAADTAPRTPVTKEPCWSHNAPMLIVCWIYVQYFSRYYVNNVRDAWTDRHTDAQTAQIHASDKYISRGIKIRKPAPITIVVWHCHLCALLHIVWYTWTVYTITQDTCIHQNFANLSHLPFSHSMHSGHYAELQGRQNAKAQLKHNKFSN